MISNSCIDNLKITQINLETYLITIYQLFIIQIQNTRRNSESILFDVRKQLLQNVSYMCVVYVCTYISLGSHLLSLSNNSKSCTNIYVFYVKRNVSSSPPLLGQSQQQITMKCRESFLLTWNSVVSHQMKMLFDISGFV